MEVFISTAEKDKVQAGFATADDGDGATHELRQVSREIRVERRSHRLGKRIGGFREDSSALVPSKHQINFRQTDR